MKKNTILALVISFFFVLACIVGYFLYKGEVRAKEGVKRTFDHLEKVKEMTNNNNGDFDLSTLPEDSPLRVDTAWVEIE